jgi:kinesin family protein 1
MRGLLTCTSFQNKKAAAAASEKDEDEAADCDDDDDACGGDDDDSSVEDEKQESLDDLPSHLKIGQEFTMRVTILQAYGISPEYSDIFTQFK